MSSLVADSPKKGGSGRKSDHTSAGIESLSLGPGTSTNNRLYINNITRLLQERSGCHGRVRRKVQLYDNVSGKPIKGQQASFTTALQPLKHWVEERSITLSATKSEYCNLPENTKSTISMSYRCDGKTFASSHGDHTIKVIDSETLRILHTLVGHPRTPWTVKYHPTDINIIASGCLQGQVRVWDVENEHTIHLVYFESSIISMSFHPTLPALAVVAANVCHLWNYETDNSSSIIHLESPNTGYRAVTFVNDGARIILGETNGNVSDFLSQNVNRGDNLTVIKVSLYRFDTSIITTLEPQEWKRALSQERAVVGTALLYNCGGIDVSPCGKMLIACFVDTSRGEVLENNEDSVEGSSSSGSSQRTVSGFGAKRGHDRLAKNNDGIVMKTMMSVAASESKASPDKKAEKTKLRTPPFLRRVRRRTSATPYKLGLFSLEDHNFGALLKSRQLSKAQALGVTSTKFSPSGSFVILGFGARAQFPRHDAEPSITNIYRLSDMNLVAEIKSREDDLNLALFHPMSGYGFIYGTRHGRIRRVHIGCKDEAE
eukprot:g14516.t1